MFIVKSYLKRPSIKINSLQNLNQYPENYFVDINDHKSINEIKNKIDANNIEGVLYLEYYNTVIMGYTYWDVIDDLWAYIADLIEDCLQNGESKIGFPDQPITLRLKSINRELVSFSIESSNGIKMTFPKKELFATLLESGEIFFLRLQEYMGLDYRIEIDKFRTLKKLIE